MNFYTQKVSEIVSQSTINQIETYSLIHLGIVLALLAIGCFLLFESKIKIGLGVFSIILLFSFFFSPFSLEKNLTQQVSSWKHENYFLKRNSIGNRFKMMKVFKCPGDYQKVLKLADGKSIISDKDEDCFAQVGEIECGQTPVSECMDNIKSNISTIVRKTTI